MIEVKVGNIVYQGSCVSFPVIIQGLILDKPELYALGAICLGVQTHCYEAQKWIITKIVKAI